jgi:hypothetical protein
MTKQDEEFLNRVAKQAPEALDADVDATRLDGLIVRLLNSPPTPKRKAPEAPHTPS